ncbi:hypothetical protein D0C28_25375 [Rhizobium sp. AU243]|nr:hypothetical protein D0C28_25375 [Rhizobium sp. AU243]
MSLSQKQFKPVGSDALARGKKGAADEHSSLHERRKSKSCRSKLSSIMDDNEITVFKAVGTGLSDLAAGALAYRNLTRP